MHCCNNFSFQIFFFSCLFLVCLADFTCDIFCRSYNFHFIILQLSERLHGGLVNERGPRSFCSSRLHANGTCSCETSLMAEISSIHATVLRIIMLTEALNEVNSFQRIFLYGFPVGLGFPKMFNGQYFP